FTTGCRFVSKKVFSLKTLDQRDRGGCPKLLDLKGNRLRSAEPPPRTLQDRWWSSSDRRSGIRRWFFCNSYLEGRRCFRSWKPGFRSTYSLEGLRLSFSFSGVRSGLTRRRIPNLGGWFVPATRK